MRDTVTLSLAPSTSLWDSLYYSPLRSVSISLPEWQLAHSMFAKTGNRTDLQTRRDATGCELAHRAKGCVYLTLQCGSHENQPRTFVIKLVAAGDYVGPMFDPLLRESCVRLRAVCVWLYVKMWERRGYEVCSSYFRVPEDAQMLVSSYFQFYAHKDERRLSEIGKSWLGNLIHAVSFSVRFVYYFLDLR